MQAWERVLSDVEAAAAGEETLSLAAEVAERVRWEAGKISLADRWTAAVGTREPVTVTITPGVTVQGLVEELGEDYVGLRAGDARVLVPLTAVVVVTGLPTAFGGSASTRLRTGFGHALRRLVRDRGTVRVHLVGSGSLEGRLQRVGSDHVDLVGSRSGRLGAGPSVTAGATTVALARIAGVATLPGH